MRTYAERERQDSPLHCSLGWLRLFEEHRNQASVPLSTITNEMLQMGSLSNI